MKNNNFDFLRFLLAFIVVVGHTIALSGKTELLVIKAYFNTDLAVKGFFIISGFLITQSYISTKSLGLYFKKRARRLLPAYITVILISAVFFSFISTYTLPDYFKSTSLYKYLIANLLFLNFIQPCLPGVFENNIMCSINGALWSLKVEVMFYLLVPFIVFFISKTQRKYLFLAIIYILSLIYGLFMDYRYNSTGNNIYNLIGHQLPGYMTFFAAGIMLYYYKSIFERFRKYMILPAIVIFVIETFFRIEILKPFAFACILFYIAYNFKYLNNWGKYGDFSYGIYIYHFPIIQLLFLGGCFFKFNPWLMLLVVIVLTVICGILSWNVTEKRFLKR
jgi:peptidoglycan/LPS O-acetylase OafA/YrhL